VTESRRRFLREAAALLASGAAAGTFLEGCGSSGPPVYRYAPSGSIIDLYLSWYPELYATGGAVELQLEGTERSIVVVRTGKEIFTAVSPLCTHQGCKVRMQETQFRCPCHGSRYAFDGALLGGPAEKPLVSYRTEFREVSLRIFLA
jgi:Rieske Fe-S protein